MLIDAGDKVTLFGLPIDWSGVGTMITAIIALIALLFAWRELATSRAAAAQDIYKEFLAKSLENPAFIYPEPSKVQPDRQLFDGDPDRFWQYEVYVDLMLAAFEQWYMLQPKDKTLEKYLGGYLYSHEKYLMSEYFKQFIYEMDRGFWEFAQHAMDVERKKWNAPHRKSRR